MRLLRLLGPGRVGDRLKIRERGGEGPRRGVDREERLVDAAELERVGMDMDELLARHRNVEERVAAARRLAEPRADRDQQIGCPEARAELGLTPSPTSPA